MSYKASEIITTLTTQCPFPAVQHAIKSTREKWLSNHEFEGELLLYHYTNLKGLSGIIKKRAIRCTQFDYLNDPLELRYGKELIIQKLKELSGKETNKIIKEFIDNLINESKNLGQTVTHSIFIASFCDSPNLQNQWRGYAAKGCGYNIGIAFNSETKAWTDNVGEKEQRRIYLRKIIYKIDKQESIIKEYLTEVIESIRNSLMFLEKYPQFEQETELSKIRLSIENLLVDIMVSLKNPVYAQENEWRLLRIIRWDQIPPIIKFRKNEDEFVLYVNTYLFDEKDDVKVFPLKEIRYGPMLNEYKTKKALDLFIKKNLLSPKTIKLRDDIDIKGK